MNPHRSPDYKQLAEEREQRVAELSEELGAVRRAVRGQRLQSWSRVLLFTMGVGACTASFVALTTSWKHRAPAAPAPCLDSAVVIESSAAPYTCAAGAVISSETAGEQTSTWSHDVVVVLRCTCPRGAAP
jgi:hypothetical protein